MFKERWRIDTHNMVMGKNFRKTPLTVGILDNKSAGIEIILALLVLPEFWLSTSLLLENSSFLDSPLILLAKPGLVTVKAVEIFVVV